jgi:hypothetical protein
VSHDRARPLVLRLGRRRLTLLGLALAASPLALPGGGSSGTAKTVSVTPVADVYVSAAAPRRNFGRARTIAVDRQPVTRALLRFRVRGLTGGVRRATLKLYATQVRGHGLRVTSVRSRAWSERRVTFASAPALGRTVARTRVVRRGWIAVDVTSLVRRPGTVNLALAVAAPPGKIVFASREARRRAPRLVVTSGAPSGPVIAAAGNIACDPTWPQYNGGKGTATDCHQAATSDVLAQAKLAAVLTLGDAQYGCGGYSAYQQAYGATWGRLKSITHPTPGNHDYTTAGGSGCDPSGRAGGYFDYFGAAAGQYGRSYYSFDVGTWHIISLDSQCSAVGGCGPGSPEETWLRADLVAHPAKCTLAYWHYPVFSSGIGLNRPDALPLWDDLDRMGADVVLSAHDHDYERFGLQHANGSASPRGMREFVVGTGGRMRHAFAAVASNSQVRDNTTWGVLELTLHPSSYDWRFVPVAGGKFTDSGSSSCV